MKKILDFISRHAKMTLFVIILITLFFLYQAMGIGLNASYGAFMPWGEYADTYQGGVEGQKPVLAKADIECLDAYDVLPITTVPPSGYASAVTDLTGQELPDYEYDTNYLVLIKGDIYAPEALTVIEQCIGELENTRELSDSFSVLDFVTVEKKGTRLATVPMAPAHPDGWNEENAAVFRDRVMNDPVTEYYLVGGGKSSLYFDFRISTVSNARLEELSAMLDPVRELGLQVIINGGEVINHKVMEYLQKDLFTLIGLCLAVILVVFYLCFRSKRSVLIPMSLSVIGLIWTFGTMAMMDIDITILNIVTPCMVLTLGSAYSIHVLSEYYAAYARKDDTGVASSVAHISKTILFACLTTVCGFLALCISQTEGLREFGISVSIGIAYCALLAITYLPAILSIVRPPRTKQIQRYSEGIMSRMIKKLSDAVVKYWVWLLIAFILLFCCFMLVKDKVSVDSNYMSYFPESDPFGRDSKTFAKEMGGANPITIYISAPSGSERFFLQSENLSKVFDYEQYLKESDDILQSLSFSSYVAHASELMTGEYGIPESSGLMNMLSRLIILMQNQTGGDLSTILSPDGNQMALTIQHWDASEQDLMTTGSITRVLTRMTDGLGMLPDGTSVTLSSDAIVNVKFSNRLLADQTKSTILSMTMVFILVVLLFRSLKEGIFVLVPVMSGIMINYVFMFLMDIPFDMVTVSFSSIAIGCGVDDAIHFLLRFRELRKNNGDKDTSWLLKMTLTETGRPIILTTVSVVFGMMMLSFASYTPIRYFGLLMSISLFGCMVSTLVFMPPVILLFSKLRGRKK